MQLEDSTFYDHFGKELEVLGFGLYSNENELFPIWFHPGKQIYIEAISLVHFEKIKSHISPKIWQERIILNRNKFKHFFCVWEDTWYQQSDFIRKHIFHLIHGYKSIFARDLKLDFIPENLANEFLTTSHILGFSKGKSYLGIFVPPHRHFRGIKSSFQFDNNPLVGVVVMGKTLVMKDEKYLGQKSAELVRFASLPGTRIVGGLTKALEYYKHSFLVDNVMTYIDLEWNDGKGFLGMGFHLESMTNPLLFKLDDFFNRSLVDNWDDANACNAGNLKLRYVLK